MKKEASLRSQFNDLKKKVLLLETTIFLYAAAAFYACLFHYRIAKGRTHHQEFGPTRQRSNEGYTKGFVLF